MGEANPPQPPAWLERLEGRLRGQLAALGAEGGMGCAREYEDIRVNDIDKSMEAANRRENSSKNRYCNVLPFNDTRVVLGDGGYINASLVQSETNETPAWTYIAAQGPLENTSADFWGMVLQYKCKAVVMLTQTNENRRVKCAQYYPTEQGKTLKMEHFRLMLASTECLNGNRNVEVRIIHVSTKQNPEPFIVRHYLYKDWPDHGTPPSVMDIRCIMEDLEATGTGACSHPPVIHCSAGIGRTGTFCTLDVILRRLKQNLAGSQQPSDDDVNAMTDIKGLVMALRDQRRGMVQTVEQYYFCYQGLHEIVLQLAGKA